jgi:hypothetical protein
LRAPDVQALAQKQQEQAQHLGRDYRSGRAAVT